MMMTIQTTLIYFMMMCKCCLLIYTILTNLQMIARSADNTLSFDVGMSSYASGFGNPSLEFWLGTET